MKLSRIIMLFALVFFVGLGAGMGLYISKTTYNKNYSQSLNSDAKSVETTTKNLETDNVDKVNAIGPQTKVIKKQVYTKGQEFEKLTEERVSEDIIGMDKELFSNYAKNKGYMVEEFTNEKVVMVEKINKWPEGLYVLKSVEDNIVLFKIDEKGELKEISTTGVVLDQVSEHDKEELLKGKVYKTIEEAETTIGDYDS